MLAVAFLGALVGAAAAAGVQVLGVQRAAQPPGPPAPVQVGLWVRQESLVDPEGLRAAVGLARQLGVQDLYVQVLSRGEAAYRSAIWPMPALPRMPADPLAEVLALARRAGLRVHGWLLVYPWGRLDAPPTDPRHPLVRHPEWVTVDREGRSLWRYRVGEHPEVNGLFVDPGLEGVRRVVVETVQELARRYDLDGIHLDYVRYPGPHLGYHPAALQRFWQASGLEHPPAAGSPSASVALPVTPEEVRAWQAFREQQVSTLVREVASALREEGLALALSAAVMPELRRARESYAQNWLAWLQAGWVSSVALMSYTTDPSQLGTWVRSAVASAGGRAGIRAGIGVYRLPSGRPEELVNLVRTAWQAGASGIVLFSFESLEGRPALQQAARAAITGLGGAAPGR
ncbi:MAG TPA: family 10 glycosylhydrolase [Limnochordales bacterium]